MQGSNNDGGTPTTEELVEWTETYGLTHPVVSDPNYGEAFYGNGYLPSMATLAPNAVIVETGNSYSTSTIEEYLPGSDQEVTTEE